MFSGSIPALVTPFRDGAFDEKAFRKLVDWQIDSGSSGLVPCGTTGENSTLSNAEHHRVIEVCVEQAAGRVPVIAGCGMRWDRAIFSSSTDCLSGQSASRFGLLSCSAGG